MASHFMEADVTIEELRHSSKKKKTKQSTESIGQLCLFWHLWRQMKGQILCANAIPSKILPFMW